MGEQNAKRSLHLRLETRQHERLQELASQNGTPITELVRELLERALEQDTSIEILTRTQAIATCLGVLEQRLGSALPALHDRLRTLEQLVCGVDANAARRREHDHARQNFLWASSRQGIWELQQLSCHLLEYAMASHGYSREVSSKLHADCQDTGNVGFTKYRNTAEARCAELESGAPPVLHPPPAIAAEIVAALRSLDEGLETAGSGPRDGSTNLANTFAEVSQPSLFDGSRSKGMANPTDGLEPDETANGARPNGAANGGGEAVP